MAYLYNAHDAVSAGGLGTIILGVDLGSPPSKGDALLAIIAGAAGLAVCFAATWIYAEPRTGRHCRRRFA
ncbi:MAG TPA: hypothetical protein VMV17_18080 [Streptosporangiaceae bacterium]|nr:hypothetical protein [Streptosporangiaceae bacterium]